jgi:hypothetical protein
MGLEREAHHSPPVRVQVNKAWVCVSTSPYVRSMMLINNLKIWVKKLSWQ